MKIMKKYKYSKVTLIFLVLFFACFILWQFYAMGSNDKNILIDDDIVFDIEDHVLSKDEIVPDNDDFPPDYDPSLRLGIGINTINGRPYIFTNATLQDTKNEKVIFHGRINGAWYSHMPSSKWLEFLNIPDGVYILTINTTNYPQYVDENFVVNHDREIKDILLLPTGHKGLQYTITNQTGMSIKTISTKLYSERWKDIQLENNLDNGKSYTLRPDYGRVPENLNIRLVDINDDIYTKYNVPTPLGTTIIFTRENKDSGTIDDIAALSDSYKFDLYVSIKSRDKNSLGYAQITAYNEIGNITMSVNDEEIFPRLQGFVNRKFSWSVQYPFEKGQTYSININVTSLDIDESLQFTVPQDIEIDFPEILDTNDIPLAWRFIPNDHINTDLMSIHIISEYTSNIEPTARKFTIPAGSVPSLRDDKVIYRTIETLKDASHVFHGGYSHTIMFLPTNYTISNRVLVNGTERYAKGYARDWD